MREKPLMKALWLEREPITRHVYAIMCALAGGMPVVSAAAGHAPLTAVVAVGCGSVPVGVFLAVRADRAAMFCHPEEILIRGLVRTKRIPVRDVVGVRGNHLYWCSPRGALRRSRMTGIADTPSKGPTISNALNRNPQRLDAWIEQAVTGRLKSRARKVSQLNDSELSRELQLATAGTRWEAKRRRWPFPEPPKDSWRTLRDSAASEAVKRRTGTTTV
jgi:hypothetical protein